MLNKIFIILLLIIGELLLSLYMKLNHKENKRNASRKKLLLIFSPKQTKNCVLDVFVALSFTRNLRGLTTLLLTFPFPLLSLFSVTFFNPFVCAFVMICRSLRQSKALIFMFNSGNNSTEATSKCFSPNVIMCDLFFTC